MERTPLRPGGSIKRKRPRPATPQARKRKAAKKQSEWARIYGSKERVEAIKTLVCYACGKERAENAHTENGGTGRKAGWETIADLGPNCHTLAQDSLHRLGSVEAFDRVHGTDLRARAAFLAALLPANGGDT